MAFEPERIMFFTVVPTVVSSASSSSRVRWSWTSLKASVILSILRKEILVDIDGLYPNGSLGPGIGAYISCWRGSSYAARPSGCINAAGGV